MRKHKTFVKVQHIGTMLKTNKQKSAKVATFVKLLILTVALFWSKKNFTLKMYETDKHKL